MSKYSEQYKVIKRSEKLEIFNQDLRDYIFYSGNECEREYYG